MLGSLLERVLKDLNCLNGKRHKGLENVLLPLLYGKITAEKVTTREDLSRLSGQGRPQQQLSDRSHRCHLGKSEAEAFSKPAGADGRRPSDPPLQDRSTDPDRPRQVDEVPQDR